ncbi:MAG: phosphoribosyltransferase family protein [Methylovulum sp.]|jgi:hypothetical protein|nr:phosphoribosyltransferase family protein [Methylovulum sp.]MCF7999743.1 phosphoribosyltransferase family protein [Methylovulum sp.]
MQKTITITLATGTLQLDMAEGRIPLKRLLGFAARISSQRKFLFVSKVLGKHYPVSPRMMAWSYRHLARAILARGLGDASSVWIGMAETATGLGYGVFAAAYEAGVRHALFMQSSRYHLEGKARLAFTETHSHATDFFLYYPEQPVHQTLFLTAQTLVLIDDEISTGRTFSRLIAAYQAINPHLQRVFIVSLVNFAHPDDRLRVEQLAGISVQWVCIRQGVLHFVDSHNLALDAIHVNVSGNGACKKHLLAWPGRLGMSTPLTLAAHTVEALIPHIQADNNDPRPILVLGTGECNTPAFLLGRCLAARGFPIKLQSTTRSPIHLGNDISQVCQFEDNYDDGIPNFIYNVRFEDYRHIIVCHETPLGLALLACLHDWQAISARFSVDTENPHLAQLHFHAHHHAY